MASEACEDHFGGAGGVKQRYILGICVLIGCACVKMLFHPPPLHRQRFCVFAAKAGDKQHSGGPETGIFDGGEAVKEAHFFVACLKL